MCVLYASSTCQAVTTVLRHWSFCNCVISYLRCVDRDRIQYIITSDYTCSDVALVSWCAFVSTGCFVSGHACNARSMGATDGEILSWQHGRGRSASTKTTILNSWADYHTVSVLDIIIQLWQKNLQRNLFSQITYKNFLEHFCEMSLSKQGKKPCWHISRINLYR